MERRSEQRLAVEPVAALDWAQTGSHHNALADVARECSRSVRLGLSIVVIAGRLTKVDDSADSLRMRPRLRTFQRRVADSLRHTDTVVRLSEREILALLPGANLQGGLAAAGRLAASSLSQARKGRGLVYDLGVAAFSSADASPQDLIDRARADYGLSVKSLLDRV